MKRNALQVILALFAVIVLSTALILATNSRLTPVTAQETDEVWLTSADPPAGMTVDSFSPPDIPPTVNQDISPYTPDVPDAPDVIVSWRVIGSALKPREDDVSYTVNTNGSCTYVSSGDTFTVWNITPMLPQGAVVDTLRIYYNDTNASNSTAWFTVYDLYGAIVDEWSVSTSGNTGNSFNDSDTINHTIDHSLYAYLLNWRPNVSGSTMQLCGFRVFYTPPPFGLAFLPAVTNNP